MFFTSYFNATARIAEDVVNTFNPVRNIEKMRDTTTLAHFLLERGVHVSAAPVMRDLEAFRALRPLLRSVFEVGGEASAVDALNGMLLEHRAAPHYTDHDGESWHLHVARPDAPVVDQLAVNSAMGLLAVITTTGMQRLHTCEGRNCAEVFVDVSRNQSRRYCSPLICGNRAHAATHRARTRAVGRGGAADG
jgi:predicted RNA-binding Zn ribbon-like protein